MSPAVFDLHCNKCPRLVNHLAQVKDEYPGYYAKPVPAFGDPQAKLLIIGLAPGMHGANATGRPFTGDYAGILLYRTLHRYGYSNYPESTSVDDGLILTGCRITNAVKCLPPNNKPSATEINTCNQYLEAEMVSGADSADRTVILALGRIAHQSVLKALKLKQSQFAFGHGNLHHLSCAKTLVDSYHCSRYNTQTKRLSEEMFEQIFETIGALLDN